MMFCSLSFVTCRSLVASPFVVDFFATFNRYPRTYGIILLQVVVIYTSEVVEPLHSLLGGKALKLKLGKSKCYKNSIVTCSTILTG